MFIGELYASDIQEENNMFRKVSVRLSIALIIIIGVIMSAFTIYLVSDQTKQMNQMLLDKGILSAKTGARIMGNVLEDVVDSGLFTIDQVFDHSLTPITLPERIINSYKNDKDVSEQDLDKIKKYHYTTTLDSYLDNTILSIQDEFLTDAHIVFAALVDSNGYVPTHNSKYNQLLTGNFTYDKNWNRIKRVFDDKIGLAAAQNAGSEFLHQLYRRDTGELMADISAPVFVKGKRWGAFRVGLSMKKTEKTISDLKRKLILMMSVLLFVSVIFISLITESMMKPLDMLHDVAEKVARGDLSCQISVKSKDEIGDLARSFNKMTEDLKHYIKDLEESTKAKERIQSELMIANQIQTSMLPRIFPAFPNNKEFDIYAIMDPAKEVGGDFYDFFLIDKDKLCLIIGDVSGKGVPAALFMVICKILIKREALQGIPPEKIMYNVNNILCPDNDTCMFATVFCAILNINSGELQIVNAGHNTPLLLTENKEFEFYKTKVNTFIGAMENINFVPAKTILKCNDIIFLYTDGVTEAMNINNELFSEERLKNILVKYKNESIEQIVQKVRAEVAAFANGAEQSDDITILALKYNK